MKKSNRRPSGFTLVEVLIVVVIMAILAATIVPQFSNSTNDAKVSSAKFNLHTLRSQIELYKSQHNGGLPDLALTKLTQYTDANGNPVAVPDSTHPYGPYISSIPMNSVTNTNTTIAQTGTPTGQGTGTAGWLYDATTGKIWFNDTTTGSTVLPFSAQ